MSALSRASRTATFEFLRPAEDRLDLALHRVFLEVTGFDLGGWVRLDARLPEVVLTVREVPDSVREHYSRDLDTLYAELLSDEGLEDLEDPDPEVPSAPPDEEVVEYEVRLADLRSTFSLDPEDAAVLTALVETAVLLADARVLLHRDR